MSAWPVLLMFLMGLGMVVHGLVIRFDREGRHRAHFDRYFDKSWPFYYRNRAFVLIPGGITFLLWGIGSVFAEVSDGQWLLVEAALVILGLLAVPIAIVLQYRPPDWLKPAWLREEERRRQEQR